MVLITQKRLITTVSAFVSNMADLEAYKEAGVENVRFCAVHDLRTSAICQKHDRKVVPISKAVAGVNIPPMHPHCRSTIEPVIDEEIENNKVVSDGVYELTATDAAFNSVTITFTVENVENKDGVSYVL